MFTAFALTFALASVAPVGSLATVAVPVSPGAPIATTPEVAAARIAKQERVELGSVSYDGHTGDTSLELARVTALGDAALPLLLEMARSPSPVARVAAAAGLKGRNELAARVAVGDLAQDPAPVTVMYGCLVDGSTVKEAVHHILMYGSV